MITHVSSAWIDADTSTFSWMCSWRQLLLETLFHRWPEMSIHTAGAFSSPQFFIEVTLYSQPISTQFLWHAFCDKLCGGKPHERSGHAASVRNMSIRCWRCAMWPAVIAGGRRGNRCASSGCTRAKPNVPAKVRNGCSPSKTSKDRLSRCRRSPIQCHLPVQSHQSLLDL